MFMSDLSEFRARAIFMCILTAIADYIELAQRKKKLLQSKQKGAQINYLKYEEQIMVWVKNYASIELLGNIQRYQLVRYITV